MPTPPIIVIKKKGGHGGHHGGAWKVAYADFVTAMMALFIVLWLLNTNKPVQEAVAGYFRDPTGTSKKFGTSKTGEGAGDGLQATQQNLEELKVTKQNMADLKEQLQKSIEKINNLEKLRKNVEMTLTSEGLRIELLESEKGTFFDSGSSALNQVGQEMVTLLAGELGKVPNHISVEGHTDAKPFVGEGSYSNWELSTDRANAARRLMQQSGLRADQVSQVRGFADQHLRNKTNPEDPSNRRISIIVQYIDNDAEPTGESTPAVKEADPAKPPAALPPAAPTTGKSVSPAPTKK
ncbi:MAG: flagellar motor protein MotB [Terriglobales bacterium]